MKLSLLLYIFLNSNHELLCKFFLNVIFFSVYHTVLFTIIAVNSVIASQVFSQVFDAFNSRCILYAEPVFIIDKIGKFNKSEINEITTESISDSTIEGKTDSTINITTTVTPTAKMEPSHHLAPKPEIRFSNKRKEDTNFKIIEEWNFSKKIPGTENYYLLNNTIFFKNDSVYAEIDIKMTKTDFSSLMMCDYIRFTTLSSVVAASTFAGIVIIYGRGGRGYPADA